MTTYTLSGDLGNPLGQTLESEEIPNRLHAYAIPYAGAIVEGSEVHIGSVELPLDANNTFSQVLPAGPYYVLVTYYDPATQSAQARWTSPAFNLNANKNLKDVIPPPAGVLEPTITLADITAVLALGTTTDTLIAAQLANRVSASRAALNKVTERVFNVLDFGAVANGTTDDTTACQAAIDAAGPNNVVAFPAGTIVVTALTGYSGQTWRGAGREATILKRKNADTSHATVTFDTKTGFRVCDLTIDGNKANQTVGATNLVITSSATWALERVGLVNAKAVAGYGGGVVIVDGTNDTTLEKSTVRDCRVVGNDGSGIYISKDWFITLDSNRVLNNSGSGIVALNYVFPPVQDVHDFLVITNNQSRGNTGCGIEIYGPYESGASEAVAVYGPTVPAARAVVIAGNQCSHNTNYGIAFSGSNGAVTGNVLVSNGNSTNNGGALFNAYSSVFSNNSLFNNASYGVDAGGSYQCVIANNAFQFNGLTLGGTDINLGASRNTIVSGNNIQQAGTAACTGIGFPGIDGTNNADPFPIVGFGAVITGNLIASNGQAGSIGISLSRLASLVTVTNNTVVTAAAGRAFIFAVQDVRQAGNHHWVNSDAVATIASAATLVIPDVGDEYWVTGTTGVTSIQTDSSNAFAGKVRDVAMTNGGSGYSQLSPPTVTFTGGGGTGAAATAAVSKAGQVIGLVMTNYGTGYTSPPAVSFSSGSAAGTAIIGCNNFAGRTIRLHFLSNVTVTDGSNLILAGNYVSGSGGGVLTLRGSFGNWYEVARAVH